LDAPLTSVYIVMHPYPLHMDASTSAAFERILAAGFEPRLAPFPHRVVVMVVAAQGILDNGGFAYLLGLPFDPPADEQDFVRAYAAIGAHDCAAAIEAALARKGSGAAIDWSDLDAVVVGRGDEIDARLSAWIHDNRDLLP
jgi:hypothetical protein